MHIQKSWSVFPLMLILMVPNVFSKPMMTIPINRPDNYLLHKAKLLGVVDPNERNTIVVWVKARNEDKWPSILSKLYNYKSTDYQKFLTNAQFEKNYAPDFESEEVIRRYFIKKGLSAEIHNHRLHVSGTFYQIEQVFQVTINYYRYKKQRVFATTNKPHLEANIAKLVSDISGMDDFPRYHSMFKQLKSTLPNTSDQLEKSHQFKRSLGETLKVPTQRSQDIFIGSNLQHVYNLSSIPPMNSTVIDGTGQTIIILNSCGKNTPEQIKDDANLYNAISKIRPLDSSNFAVINPSGLPFNNATCEENEKASWSREIALDVQAAHTIAPGANIILVLVTKSNNLLIGLADTISYLSQHNYSMAGFPNAYVISNSWGRFGDGPDELKESFFQAAMEGISINFASGDDGDGSKFNNGFPTAIYPASSSYVTAVGGTSLFVDNNWSYVFETSWGNKDKNGTFLYGSGGGISQYNEAPPWQETISGLTAGGYNGIISDYKKRAVPDIAMLADPNTGLFVFERNECLFWCASGGTSLSSPLFTATLALINQARYLLANGNARPIGLVAPYLYNSMDNLADAEALQLISPPHQVIEGTSLVWGAPLSVFRSKEMIFNWDSSLSFIEGQFWNDTVGFGSPNLPNFVKVMMTI